MPGLEQVAAFLLALGVGAIVLIAFMKVGDRVGLLRLPARRGGAEVNVSIHAIMACAEYGHIRTGVSDSTDPSRTVWADHCSRCFADLREPPTTEEK